MLQREIEPAKSQKLDAAAAFLASLEEPKLTSLAEAGKKPPIEILPPGMPSLSAPPISIQKKPASAAPNSQQPPGKPLALEAPPTTKTEPLSAPPSQQSESTPKPGSDQLPSQSTADSTPDSVTASSQPESGETVIDDKNEAPTSAPASNADQISSGENVQPAPISKPAPTPILTEAPPQVAVIQEANVPTTAPLGDFLA